MAFTEKTEYKIEVLENNHIQYRRSDIVLKDGVEVGRQYFREVLFPGEDVSGQPERVRNIANTVWTPEVVAAYQSQLTSAAE